MRAARPGVPALTAVMLLSANAKVYLILAGIAAATYLAAALVMGCSQRSMIYFPSHAPATGSALQPWVHDGGIIGYCHVVPQPRTIWLMTHGNGGQASQRGYVLKRLSAGDSLYVLEYPGYGLRPGAPTRGSIDAAANEAYDLLRREFPGVPVAALGESLGSGAACQLATRPVPPDKIVLIVPYDTLASVAQGRVPWLPVKLILQDRWDNIASLKSYPGPVDIFGGAVDDIIPVEHARNLAAHVPQAHFTVFDGGHNDWSSSAAVKIER